MPGPGNAAFARAVGEVWAVYARYTGAGAAAPTKVYGPGIASITRQGVGQYTINFQDVGAQIIDFNVIQHTAAGAGPLVGKMVNNSFSRANRSVQFEMWDLATPTRTELINAVEVTIQVTFSKNPT